MPLANSNQNPDGAEAPEPQAVAVDQNSKVDMRQILEKFAQLNTTVKGLATTVDELKTTLNQERKERIESQELLQSKIDQNKAEILNLEHRLDVEKAERQATILDLENRLDVEKAERQVLKSKVEELKSRLDERDLDALQSKMSAVTPQKK